MENLLGQTEMPKFDFENNQHPLLISTVVKEIFKHSSIADLKNFRLVCKYWNYEGFRLLKKIEWKSPIQFDNINHLNSFVKTYGPCPQNILTRNLDCGQILVPSDKEPEIFFHKILPIANCITGLKVNINIQEKRTFVAHEAFQPLTQSLQHFDVRFIKNDNISLSEEGVYPRTDLPSLPALTSVIIRMDGFVKYPIRMNGRVKYGNRIVHSEYGRFEQFTKDGFVVFESERKMLVELIQELVTKSPMLSDIYLVISNNSTDFERGVPRQYPFKHISINILRDLKRNELEKITHLRFNINDMKIEEGDEITHLLNLAKCGLNKLNYICIDLVFIAGGILDFQDQNLLAMLELQKETLEYFKVKDFSRGQDSMGDTLTLPPFLPKLKVLKLAGNFGYQTNILDLNSRFPNLNEIDFTGTLAFLTKFQEHAGPLIPYVQIKKLSLDNESFSRFRGTPRRLSEWFPNVTQVKYHMADMTGTDEDGSSGLWTMASVEHLVLKVPLCPPDRFWGISAPVRFICGGIHADTSLLLPEPSITWLTGLKSLKIKQRRRYGCPEAGDESGGRGRFPEKVDLKNRTENLGRNILSQMQNLEHFTSDYHCFSQESLAQLKVKIPDFQPGKRLN